jgi:hypothetical protein
MTNRKLCTPKSKVEGCWRCCHCPIFQCWLAALMRVSLSTLWLFDPDCYSWRTMLGPWKKGWLLSASDTILVARTAPWILQRTVGWSCLLQDFHLSPQTQTDDMRWHAVIWTLQCWNIPKLIPPPNAMLFEPLLARNSRKCLHRKRRCLLLMRSVPQQLR